MILVPPGVYIFVLPRHRCLIWHLRPYKTIWHTDALWGVPVACDMNSCRAIAFISHSDHYDIIRGYKPLCGNFLFFQHYIVYHIWCIWSHFAQLSMLTINTLYTQFCTSNTSCINSHINCPYIVKFQLCKWKTSTQSIGHGEKNNQNCQHCYQTYCFHPHWYWSCWRILLDIWHYSPISCIYLPLSICNGSQSWLETVFSLIMIPCIL